MNMERVSYIEDFKRVVEIFHTVYENLEREEGHKRPRVYYRSISQVFIVHKFLSEKFRSEHLLSSELIRDWRGADEWPENEDNLIISSILNLLIFQNTTYMPIELQDHLLKYREIKRRKKLRIIYGKVYRNIELLNSHIIKNIVFLFSIHIR